MRRKMLLFSPSLLAGMLWLWCSSSCSAKAFFWTPGAPIVINGSQLCQTIAEAPRHIPHQILAQLLFHKLHNKHTGLYWWLFVLNTEGYFCFLFTMIFIWYVTFACRILLLYFPAHSLAIFLSIAPLYLNVLFSSSSLLLISHPASFFLLFAQLLCVPLFSCLLPLTANKPWYMYSGFTFFHPVIYAVRSVPLFGWPGFHVCAEQYLGVLTPSSVFSMKHTAAGNWWGITATGCTVQTGRNPTSF